MPDSLSSDMPVAGLSIKRDLTANATGVLVGVAGRIKLFGIWVTNAATTMRFLKLYNKATAGASTDTPAMTLGIPATANGAGACISFIPYGIDFPLGLSYRATNLVADNDTTAPTANDVTVNLLFKQGS